MNRIKFVLLAAIFVAMAFTFTSCGEVGGGDSGGSSSGNDPSNSSSSSGEVPRDSIPCTKDFDYSAQFCFNNKVYELCGGGEYNPETMFCFGSKFYLKCDGEEYDPVRQICFKGNKDSNERPYLRCGGKPADPDYEFCFDSKVYPRCINKAHIYNPFEQFCFQDELYNMCGDLQYTPTVQFCDRLKVYDKCGNAIEGYNEYNSLDSLCFKDKLYSIKCSNGAALCRSDENYWLCGDNMYNEKEFCRNGIIREKCNGKEYDPITEDCSEAGNVYTLCLVRSGPDDFGRYTYTPTKFNPDEKACENNALVNIVFPQKCGESLVNEDEFCCFGTVYPINSNYFCDKDVLYAKCQGKKYNPSDSICYEGTLKARCSTNGIKGLCVHSNGLLRCKQLGGGSNYIRDPLPGMACQDNGAITSKSEMEINVGYPVAQIGDQLWMAKNLDSTISSGQYGKLYEWNSLPSCPKNFRIPDTTDWRKLVDYAGGANVAGGRLKAATGWLYNGNGTDDYGFKALPGGYAVYWGNDIIYEQGARSLWWTSTPVRNRENPETDENTNSAYYFDMISSDTEARKHYRPKDGYAYIRCMRDAAF